MTFQLSGEQPGLSAAAPRGLFGALSAWLASQRAARRRRICLESLLDLDDTRLRDIGLSRADVYEALELSGVRAGMTLSHRRAVRARSWLEHVAR